MADDSSGRDEVDDGWGEPSAMEPDAGPTADSSDEWGARDGTERPAASDRRDDEARDDGWDGIPIDLSGSSEADEEGDADEDAYTPEANSTPIDLSGSSEADEEGDADEDAYTPEANSTPIEPGDPDLENVLFVILGAIAMVLVFVRLISIPLG
ncbi:DUF7312 domain-containing protein [Natrinema marinum]|uniref:DUF7312 domain-containing protein n=1 Tax=Natrinema marinum TaxID=2961598 RepID=UPI0020C8B021|nr:hypothetical protein [Natrinema marinum]